MNTPLEIIKFRLNPKDSKGGPAVMASKGDIPWIHAGAHISYDSSVQIIGDSSIGMGSHVRENTIIQDTQIGCWTSVQDDCLLVETKIGNWVTIAHGCKVTESQVKDHAHLNISVWVGNCEVSDGAFLMANCRINGSDFAPRIIPGNMCIYGSDETGFSALSNAKLDSNFNVVEGNLRPIFFAPDADFADTGKIMTFLRDDLLPHEEGQGNIRKLSLANWVTNYSGVQIGKHTEFMRWFVIQSGSIAVYAPHIKADMLLLSTVSKLLASMGEAKLAKDVEDILKANAYLISAYNPADKLELERLSDAYEGALEVLKAAQVKLAQNQHILKIHCRVFEEAGDIFKSLNLPTSDILYSAQRIAYLGGRLAEVAERIADFTKTYAQSNLSSVYISSPEVGAAESLKKFLNPQMLDITQVEGGTIIHSHYGYTPNIHPQAQFINCLLRGVVKIGAGSFVGCSLANENANSKVSFRTGENVVMFHATAHTATKETEPVYIQNTLALGLPEDRVYIHGAQVGLYGETMLNPSVLGDGEVFSGVTLNGALGPGQNMGDDWGYISRSSELSSRLTTQAAVQNPVFMRQWRNSAFAEIDPSNAAGVQAKIVELRLQKQQEVDEMVQTGVDSYGVVFRYSPHLQAAAQNLFFAAHILKTLEDPRSQFLFNLHEAFEYLLGTRAQISASAAVSLDRIRGDVRALVEPAAALFECSKLYEDVEVGVARIVGQYQPSPIFDDNQPEHIKRSVRPEGFDFFVSPETINESMFISHRNIASIAASLISIPALLNYVERQAEKSFSAQLTASSFRA